MGISYERILYARWPTRAAQLRWRSANYLRRDSFSRSLQPSRPSPRWIDGDGACRKQKLDSITLGSLRWREREAGGEVGVQHGDYVPTFSSRTNWHKLHAMMRSILRNRRRGRYVANAMEHQGLSYSW